VATVAEIADASNSKSGGTGRRKDFTGK